jgi:hypothetical protein
MGINAQTSVPKFTSGDVLTATNTNLLTNAPPVFSGTATRDAAFGGAGEKTLAEGQLCYLEDSDIVQYYSGSAWATVGPATSKIAQVVSTTLTTTFSRASATYGDITGLTVSITPTSATSTIFVVANLSVGTDTATGHFFGRLARGGTGIAVATSVSNRVATSQQTTSVAADQTTPWSMSFLDSPASTSALTYSVQCLSAGGATIYVNRSVDDTNSGNYARAVSTITVFEVLA